MLDILWDALLDTGKDALVIIPILYVAYVVLEAMERATGEKLEKVLRAAGRFGPIIGALFGVIPECGFSAAASSFFSGGVITAGTLLAVFLSTSDEMIPVFLSEGPSQLPVLLKVLLAKIIWAVAIGYLFDLFWKRKHETRGDRIHELCEKDHCGCENAEEGNVFLAALIHTLKIGLCIILISVALNFLVGWIGEEAISSLISDKPLLGEAAAGLIGLVPNCAASVLITQLYLKGVITSGAMFSGLLVSAGTGLIVLVRMNKNRKQTLLMVLVLYLAGVLGGFLFGLIP